MVVSNLTMKTPTARKLKSGSWFIQLRLGGESIPITENTKRGCEKKAAYIKAQYMAGERRNRPSATLKYAVWEYISKRKNVLSPSTIRGYEYMLKYVPHLEDKRLDAIDWQKEINNLALAKSPKTVKNFYGFIKSVCADNGYEMPNIRLPQLEVTEHEWLTPDEIKVFMEAIEGKNIEIPALLGLHGLRRSEMLALTKDDVKDGVIHIKGAVVPNSNNAFVPKKTNKNTASTRNVTVLTPRLLYLIDELESDKLVTQHPSTIWRGINKVCRENGLPEVGIHGLRHSFASLGYNLGLPERETMELGGWSDERTVKKIYTHVAKKTRENSVNLLSDFFQHID